MKLNDIKAPCYVRTTDLDFAEKCYAVFQAAGASIMPVEDGFDCVALYPAPYHCASPIAHICNSMRLGFVSMFGPEISREEIEQLYNEITGVENVVSRSSGVSVNFNCRCSITPLKRTKKHGYFYTGSGKKKAVEPEQELPEVGSFWRNKNTGGLFRVTGAKASKTPKVFFRTVSPLSVDWESGLDIFYRNYEPDSKKYHLVNGVICVAPESVAPAYGTLVYMLFDCGPTGYVWDGLDWLAGMLSRGLVFLSEEDRKENEEALMKGVETL